MLNMEIELRLRTGWDGRMETESGREDEYIEKDRGSGNELSSLT